MLESISINVTAQTSDYEVGFIDDLEALYDQLKGQVADRNFVLVTDRNVWKVSPFWKFLSEEEKSRVLVLEPGEREKNWISIEQILAHGFENQLDRGSVMVAIGGGVVGDMTGFAASIFMRGIGCIQVPTSLLSMVDASVGGKTGIDCPQGKNLIGTITQPETVLVTPEFLETLPELEIKNGLAEMIKHGVIASPRHFEALERLAVKVRDTAGEVGDFLLEISALMADSIQIKADIVQADSHELGIRGYLNLGHTFGHAIELVSDFEIPHGRAVALGCVMAFEYAVGLGWVQPELVSRLKTVYHDFGIDLDCDLDEDEIWAAMGYDKKKQAGKLRLILPKGIGEVAYYEVENEACF